MKVTIEIEATSDGEAVAILQGLLRRSLEAGRFSHDERVDIGGLDRASYNVRVERETQQATAPEPDVQSPGVRRAGALERLADTMALIEGHLRPVVVSATMPPARELPPRYTLAENGRDIIDHSIEPGGPYRDNLVEMSEKALMVGIDKTSQRVRDNLRWISNIAYNMKQGVSASSLGPEAEFSRIYDMVRAVATDLGVKLP